MRKSLNVEIPTQFDAYSFWEMRLNYSQIIKIPMACLQNVLCHGLASISNSSSIWCEEELIRFCIHHPFLICWEISKNATKFQYWWKIPISRTTGLLRNQRKNFNYYKMFYQMRRLGFCFKGLWVVGFIQKNENFFFSFFEWILGYQIENLLFHRSLIRGSLFYFFFENFVNICLLKSTFT